MTEKFDRNKKLLEAIETEIHVRPADDTDIEHTQDVAAYEKINALFEGLRQPGDIPGKVGRYEIKKMIGSGAFGAVYLAHDPDLEREVAIKIPHADRFVSDEDEANFVKEARSTATLSDPAIVTVFDVGREDGHCYLVLDYISGASLEHALQGGTYAPYDAAKLIAKVAKGLHYAHKKGFVHRDMKPGNILLDDEGAPRITDFGLAVTEESQRQLAGQVAGTPAYMSPEQVRGDVNHLDGRSDIWALGVMLYEMLTGRHPFWRGDVQECIDEIQRREPKPPRQIDDTIPAELERIILKCLSKDVTARYTTADDLKQDLNRLRESRSKAFADERDDSHEDLESRDKLSQRNVNGMLSGYGRMLSIGIAITLLCVGIVIYKVGVSEMTGFSKGTSRLDAEVGVEKRAKTSGSNSKENLNGGVKSLVPRPSNYQMNKKPAVSNSDVKSRYPRTVDLTLLPPPLDDATTWDVATGDVTGDGYPDIVFSDSSQTAVWINDGSGKKFSKTAQSIAGELASSQNIALGYLNADSHLDAVTGNAVFVNDGSGTGTFIQSVSTPSSVSSSSAIAVGDVNNDSHTDVLVADHLSSIYVWHNDTSGQATFMEAEVTSTFGTLRDIALGDIDGDKFLDLVVAQVTRTDIFLNDGDGTFTFDQQLAAGETDAATLGDLNGDGFIDIVIGGNGNSVFINDGNGNFTTVTHPPGSDGYTRDIALADMDNDDDLDAVVAHWEPGHPDQIWINDGTANFKQDFSFDSGRAMHVSVFDMDLDKDQDVVIANFKPSDGGDTAPNTVWRNNLDPEVGVISNGNVFQED